MKISDPKNIFVTQMKISEDEQVLLQQALLMTSPNDKHFWSKVTHRFNQLNQSEYTSNDLQQYYQSFHAIKTNKKKKKQQESDGYSMATKLQQIEKGKQKMTRKRTIRSILNWADNDHRDDIFQKNTNNNKFQFNSFNFNMSEMNKYFKEEDCVACSTEHVVTPMKNKRDSESSSSSPLVQVDMNRIDTYIQKIGTRKRKII
jgi:hypothetical protein